MSGVLLYTVILSFVSGIFLRSVFVISWPVSLWFIVISIGLLMLWKRYAGVMTPDALLCISVALLGFSFGILRFDLVSVFESPSILASQVGQNVALTGQVIREPDVRVRSLHLVVAVGNENILVQTDRQAVVLYGDTVAVEGRLAIPETFVTDLGRTFDYQKYLSAQGITYTLSFARVSVTDTTTGNPILRFLFKSKMVFMAALESALPEPEVALGEGLILGVKQALGDDLETAFRKSGIIHIVVLSGYNIMLVVTFVLYVLGWFLPERARLLAGGIAIVLFALLVGLGASVVRASIMAGIALMATYLGRRYAVLRTLCIAGALMLLVNPLLLTGDVGFQLSFMATFGLILVAPQFERLMVSQFNLFSIKDFLIATLATQVAVLPLLLYHIGEFSLVAVVVNILVLPVVSLAMLGTFVTGLVALVSTSLALPFAMVTYGLLKYIIVVAMTFANLPFASVTVSDFPFILVILLYAVLGYGLYYRERQLTIMPAVLLPDSLANWTIEEVIESPLDTIQNRRGLNPRLAEAPAPIFFR